MIKLTIDRRLLSWLVLVTVVQPVLAAGPLADRATADAAPPAAPFGSDFDGDGSADLAMYLTGGQGAQAVVVLYGSKTGLEDADRQRIVAADLGGGTLGETMTSGDFDGDGYADLALGDVNARVGQADEAGAVRIVYGSAGGLDVGRAQRWTQDSPGVPGKAEADDWFGWALAAGNFGGGPEDDLAVTAWSEGTRRLDGTGAVNVLYGSAKGVTAAGSQIWTGESPGVPGRAESLDMFGGALAAGRFSAGDYDDLAVGVPNRRTASGAVVVLRGAQGGLTSKGSQEWTQDSPGIKGKRQQSDGFGDSLAVGQFGRGPHEDLAVGVPEESVAGRTHTGAVHVVYGSATGLTAAGDQLWSQRSRGIAGVREDDDHFGYSLVAANLGHDDGGEPIDDLAIAVDESIRGVYRAGQVHILYGRSAGLASTNSQILTSVSSGQMTSPGMNEVFGSVLAAGNFGAPAGGAAYADLAALAGTESDDQAARGGVHVLYGSNGGPGARGGQLWTPRSVGEAETGRAIGNLTADG